MKKTTQFVICIDNTDYPASLELHKVYRALPDAEAEVEGDLRVIDESGEDYLYPADYFLPLPVSQQDENTLADSFARLDITTA